MFCAHFLPNFIHLKSHSTCSYGQDLAQVCHQFLFGSRFSLRDLILEEPEESRASPSTRERMKKGWDGLTRFIKGLEVSVNFRTTKRYPRRKIMGLYPMAGRYQFVLEKADKKEKRVVTVEVRALVQVTGEDSNGYPQEYYQLMYGQRMKCPDAIGVVTRQDPFSVIPIEFCRLSQQMYKKVLDPETAGQVLQRATKKPRDRFRAIEAARVSSRTPPFPSYAHGPGGGMCWKLTKIGIERGNQLSSRSNFCTQTPVSWNYFWWRKDRTDGRSWVDYQYRRRKPHVSP